MNCLKRNLLAKNCFGLRTYKDDYEPPVPASLSGTVKGAFPSFIPKTDETRVQVLQGLLDQYQGEECYLTEKLDGSSATFFVNKNDFGVCTRNLELLEDPENTVWKIARALDIEGKLLKEFMGFTRSLGLETVPIIAADLKLPNDIQGLVRMATRKSLLCPDAWAEGLVIRPLVEHNDPLIGRVSFKVINPEFLLKTGQ